MATRAYAGAGVDPTTFSSPGSSTRDVGLNPGIGAAQAGVTPVTSTWINRGYYVAGADFETWPTSNAPSTTPPSTHTLIDIVSAPIA